MQIQLLSLPTRPVSLPADPKVTSRLRECGTVWCGNSSNTLSASSGTSWIEVLGELLSMVFPLWVALGCLLGLVKPAAFHWVRPKLTIMLLALTMLGMGMTLTFDDLRGALAMPKELISGLPKLGLKIVGSDLKQGAPYRTEPWYGFPDYLGLWWPSTDFSPSLDNGASPAMHALGMVSDSPSSPWKDFPSRLQITVYKTESRLCAAFLANDDPQTDKTVNYNGKSYWLLAWSASILPGCKNDALNTAKDCLFEYYNV